VKETQGNNHRERDSEEAEKESGKERGGDEGENIGKTQKGRHREEDTGRGSQRGNRRWDRGDIKIWREQEDVGRKRGREGKKRQLAKWQREGETKGE
jgi:hypothetical protein